MATGLSKTFLLFCCGSLLVLAETSAEGVDPSGELDVMGSYRVDNRHQCQRLCWYWKACGRYSFYSQNDHNSRDNCVLHGKRQRATNLMNGWMEEEASSHHSTPAGGCSNRPCSLQEMCVPVYTPHTNFVCANMNSDAWLGQSCSGSTCYSPAPADITGCFSGQCLCAAGYFYSVSQRTCLATCGNLGDSYLCYELYDLFSYDLGTTKNVNLAECKIKCASDSKCLVVVYDPKWWNCYLKYVTAQEKPESWGPHGRHVTCQRTCA